jgi:hypothetical protein
MTSFEGRVGEFDEISNGVGSGKLPLLLQCT